MVASGSRSVSHCRVVLEPKRAYWMGGAVIRVGSVCVCVCVCGCACGCTRACVWVWVWVYGVCVYVLISSCF